MKKLIYAAALAAAALTAGTVGAKDAPAVAPRDMEMWRLECGDIHLADGAIFSDTHLFDGQPRALAGSCYLIRHGKDYLLWDAGLPKTLIGAPTSDHGVSLSLKRSIVDQLAEIGVDPKSVSKIAVSHYHFDHTSQLPDFPGATLLIAEQDWAVASSKEEGIPYLVRPGFSRCRRWRGSMKPRRISTQRSSSSTIRVTSVGCRPFLLRRSDRRHRTVNPPDSTAPVWRTVGCGPDGTRCSPGRIVCRLDTWRKGRAPI